MFNTPKQPFSVILFIHFVFLLRPFIKIIREIEENIP